MGVRVKLNQFRLYLYIDLLKTPFGKFKPVAYSLLNNYQDEFFILIKGIPYCCMPDATEHITYEKSGNKSYHRLKKCARCLHAKDCPGIENGLKIATLRPIKDLPKEIVLELTKSCNQDCPICNLKKKKDRALPVKIVKNALAECESLGIKKVLFTGGEPLLYEDLVEVLRYAKERGFYVRLNTNASLLNKELITSIENYVDNILISLQGYNAKSDMALAGSGNLFLKKIKNIGLVKKSSIPIMRIGTIISQTFIKNLLSYYRLIKALGVKRWELYRPMINTKNSCEYKLTNSDFEKIFEFIITIRKKGLYLIIGNTIPFCVIKKTLDHPEIFAGNMYDDGHLRLVFDSMGHIKPSYFIDKTVGNNISDAWNHAFLKKIRSLSYLPQECKKCFYLRWCKGGSRFLAREHKRSFFATDPLYSPHKEHRL